MFPAIPVIELILQPSAPTVPVVQEVCAEGYGAGRARDGSTRGEERLVG